VVGAIGIALNPVGGSGTVAACASCITRNKLDDKIIVIIKNPFFNYSFNPTLEFLWIADKLYEKDY
jgi:hypothetical protein